MSEPYYRVRNRGLSNEPQISTTVRLMHTWYPEEGWQVHTKESEPSGFWTVASAEASTIFDNVDFNGANASGHYTMAQAVDHYQVGSSSLSGGVTYPFEVGPYQGDCTFDFKGPFPGGNGELFNEGACPPPPTGIISLFAIQCLEEMASMFPPEFDAMSFLLELKDLVGTMDTLFDIASAIKELRHRRLNIRQAARIHAGYNFGVSPILGDTASLFNTFNRVEKRIEWLLRNKQKWVRVGSTRLFELEENTHVAGFGFAGWSPGLTVRRVLQTHKLTSTARAKFLLPNVEPWLLFVRGVIQDCGFSRPLSTFWEVTPFSWLVDYFVPVSGYLKSVQHFRDPNWDVRDPNWSFATDYRFELPVWFDSTDPIGKAGWFTIRRYCRHVGLPPWEWSLTTPSTKQLSLLAAVALPED